MRKAKSGRSNISSRSIRAVLPTEHSSTSPEITGTWAYLCGGVRRPKAGLITAVCSIGCTKDSRPLPATTPTVSQPFISLAPQGRIMESQRPPSPPMTHVLLPPHNSLHVDTASAAAPRNPESHKTKTARSNTPYSNRRQRAHDTGENSDQSASNKSCADDHTYVRLTTYLFLLQCHPAPIASSPRPTAHPPIAPTPAPIGAAPPTRPPYPLATMRA